MNNYDIFLNKKSQSIVYDGFDPIWMPSFLFDFQASLVDWAIRKGRAAIFADCGLGKTPMQLVWAENIIRKTNKPVLILTPLAVGYQTVKEGEKFGIQCALSRDGEIAQNITITNYEQLHKFNPNDFVGTVCDESGILKHFSGATQKAVTRFMAKQSYRLLCTATPAPNDYVELGTSSEALGYLGYTDMLSRFFVLQDKKRFRMNDVKEARQARKGLHFARLSYRVSQSIGQWKMKGHAQIPFWRWVCSWARACRTPSDLGFSDDKFILPPLEENHHVITPKTAAEGMLFVLPAFGLKEEREERRRTLFERCEFVAKLVEHSNQVVIWVQLNDEGDTLQKMISDSVQVKGANTDDEKIEAYRLFGDNKARIMIIKPKIGAWGLNWQFCNHVITFVSHSWEQYYQAIRRCWRFGQQKPVTVDIVSSKGEAYVKDNMIRKAKAADEMFKNLIEYMNDSQHLELNQYNLPIILPRWV